MNTSPRAPDRRTASTPSTDTWSVRCVTACPRNVDLKALPSVNSVSCGTCPAAPFHQPLPAALTKLRATRSLPMCADRNCCPRKYALLPRMIASSLASTDVTVTCSAAGRVSCRSIDQGVLPSVYDPVISKLSAATSVPVAPLSRLRVVGRPRPTGRSHADSAATMIAPANPVRVRYQADRSQVGVNMGTGCVTARSFQPLHHP